MIKLIILSLYKFFILGIIIGFNQFIFSQNAPGGVATGLETWLRADIGVTGVTPITAWANQKVTGTSVLVNGSPNLNTIANTYNYNPYIDFVAPVGTLANGIAVNRQCLKLSGYTGLSGINYTSLFFSFHLTDLTRVATHVGAVSGVTYGGPANGTLHGSNIGVNAAIMESVYDPADFGASGPVSTWQRNGGNVAYNAIHSSTKHILSGSCMSGGSATVNTLLGGQQDNSNLTFVGHPRDWKGPVGEVIGYTSAITLIDRQKIHSYLAVKYGTTLSTNYLSTTGSNIFVTAAPYNVNIIGIGRDDIEVLNQRQSHNDDDFVRIYLNTLAASNALNSGSFALNISYVLMGANTDALTPTAAANLEVPVTCGITTRIAREWKVTRTNMSQNFSLDIKTATWNSCMRFLVDDDGNFGNGGTQCYYNGDGTGIVLSYASGTITISNISTVHIPNNSTLFVTVGSPATTSQFIFNNSCVNNAVQFTNQSQPITSTYSWDFGDGSAISSLLDPTHTYTASGLYNVVLTVNNNGCLSTSNQNITIYAAPIINAGVDVSVCEGSAAILSGTGGLTYSWDQGVLNNASFIPLVDLTYIVTGTDANGCLDTDQVDVTIDALPIIDAGADVTVCEGSAVILSGTGGLTYSWDQGVTDGVTFNPINPQTYTVTGTDANGCVDTDQVDVTIDALPIIDAGADLSVCEGSAVILSGTGGLTYSWDQGVTDGVTFNPINPQTYTVTGTDANGCVDTDQVVISLQTAPIINAGPDQTLCQGATITLSGSGGISYTWDNGVVNNVTFAPLLTQTYTVTGLDALGCSNSDQITITIDNASLVQFNAPIIEGCQPLLVNLTNNSIQPIGSTCLWDFGDGNTDSNCGTVQHEYTNPGCYDISLTINSLQGCVWSLTTVNYICVYALPIANFSPNPGVISDNDPISQMVNASSDAISYNWDFGDETESTDDNPIHSFPVSENNVSYEVQLIATSDKGCTDTMTRIIELTPLLLYYVPNSFTPDGNEFNQTFQPIFTAGYDPFDFTMTIYNRWGEVVYETFNDKIGWDGTFKGEIVSEGIYTWKIEFKKFISDERISINGHVNVLK